MGRVMKHKTVSRKKILSILMAVLGLSLVFIGGIFTQNTQLEKISEYATEVVTNHTNNKKLCAVMVGKTKESGSIADASSEFHNLYGTFKQEKITFASMINADKQHDIKFSYDGSPNLSMLYAGAVATIKYNGHFKHHMLPMETMFNDGNYYNVSRYLAYISQSQADAVLDGKGVHRSSDGYFTNSDYKKLLGTLIPITIDGVPSDFVIQNIYYESNYYYNGIHEVSGDFIMVSYYLPNNLRDDQNNIYFLSDYSYQNKYFMNYINQTYSSKNYSVRINHYNIIDEINDDYLLSFYYTDATQNLEWLSTFLFVISGFLLALSLFFAFSIIRASNFKSSHFYLFLSFIFLFVPYLLFSSIYSISRNIAVMSEFATKLNVLYISIYTICLVVFGITGKKRLLPKKTLSGGAYYEINI